MKQLYGVSLFSSIIVVDGSETYLYSSLCLALEIVCDRQRNNLLWHANNLSKQHMLKQKLIIIVVSSKTTFVEAPIL